MPNYRRARTKGGCYFFTLNLAKRRESLLTEHISALRNALCKVKTRHPLRIDAIVVLPDHLHALWTLPEDDTDYSVRWSLIKASFSRSLHHSRPGPGPSRRRKGESGVWQRRFWEHQIRDERDYRLHFDYIHINPLKHGLVQRVIDWPWSSFHKYVDAGVYPADWASDGREYEGGFGEREAKGGRG